MLKLDIKKAFDTISWEFTTEVMTNLGFPEAWIHWIRRAIFQGTSQVLINGSLGKKIILKHGVRQGDPLSPSLFIIAMDFLARYLQKLAQTGAIKLPYANMRPCLLYADDALLFMKPDIHQVQAIKNKPLVLSTSFGSGYQPSKVRNAGNQCTRK
ncbi:secreted RxLR effector protein 78-like [Carex rostrata]